MYYYDFVLKERTDTKPLNKKADEREKLWKLPALSPLHALQRWTVIKKVPSIFIDRIDALREYELKKRVGRTYYQFKHVRDYSRDELMKMK